MAKYTTQPSMNAFKILKRNGNGDRDTRTLHGSGFYPAISEHLTPAFVGLLGKFSHFHAPSLLNHIYIYIYSSLPRGLPHALQRSTTMEYGLFNHATTSFPPLITNVLF